MVQIESLSSSEKNKSVPYKRKNSHMVQMRACSSSGKNKSVPYKKKNSHMVQIESLFQLGEEQIWTIQVKNIIYGTNFKNFQTFISKWQIMSFSPDILELQDNAGINQIPQMLRSCLGLNHWNFIESSIIRRIWYV